MTKGLCLKTIKEFYAAFRQADKIKIFLHLTKDKWDCSFRKRVFFFLKKINFEYASNKTTKHAS